MDFERKEAVAVHYLRRLEETRLWIVDCLGPDAPGLDGVPQRYSEDGDEDSVVVASGGDREGSVGGRCLVHFEEGLRNGVLLAALASEFAPDVVRREDIYDLDLARYGEYGLSFKHTDNVNRFIAAVLALGLPDIFTPETADIYERKNMPRLVYCLHALSQYLYKLGLAPALRPASSVENGGHFDFADGEVAAMKTVLEDAGLDKLPQFAGIGDILNGKMGGGARAANKRQPVKKKALVRNDPVKVQQSVRQNPAAKIKIDVEAGDGRQMRLVRRKDEDEVDGPRVAGGETRRSCLVDFQARCRGFLVRQMLLRKIGDQQFKLGRGDFRGVMAKEEQEEEKKPKVKPVAKARRSLDEIFAKKSTTTQKSPNAMSKADMLKYGAVIAEIVAIQRYWRAHRHATDFRKQLTSAHVPLAVVRKYVHLLEPRPDDAEAEAEARALRAECSRATRAGFALRRDIESLEAKMGLAEEGKVPAADLRTFYDLARRRRKERIMDPVAALSGRIGEREEKLAHYQDFFRFLYNNPEYLGRLLARVAASRANDFLGRVVLYLYSFGLSER